MECKNCKQELCGEQNFCSNCGQKNISVLNLKFIFREILQTIFNFDSKFFKSLKYLVFKPGYLTKEYLQGKRVSYLAPIRLYLVLSFLFFFLISVFDFTNPTSDFNFSLAEEGISVNDALKNDSSEVEGTTFVVNGESVVVSTRDLKKMNYEGVLEEKLDSLTADMPAFAGYVSRKVAMVSVDDKSFLDVLRDQFSLFLILFLPFFALLYSIIFSGSKKGFVAHMVFNLHLNSFIFLTLLADLFVGLIISNPVVSFVEGTLLILIGQFYLIKSTMVFYQRKFWVAFYKYFLLLLGYLVLALLFIIVVFFSSIIVV